ARPDEKSKWVGKRGTIAIMGDGKVRFIPEDIPAATFRALCTIAGGEEISGKLDSIAPEIKAEERELKTDGPSTAAVPIAPGSDLEKLQGMWKPTGVTANGVEVPANLLAQARMTFKGNKITIQMGPKVQNETFTLDPTKSPKWIDVVGDGGTQLGVYE